MKTEIYKLSATELSNAYENKVLCNYLIAFRF